MDIAHGQPAGSSSLNCDNMILKSRENHCYNCVLAVHQYTLPSVQALVGMALILILSCAVWGTAEGRNNLSPQATAMVVNNMMMMKTSTVTAENQYYDHDHELLEISSDSYAANSAREEKEREFMEWVERVRTKTNSKGSSSSSNVWSDSEAAGNVITVNPNGGAEFTSIQAAVDSIPTQNTQRVVIQLAAGVYQEKVFVPKNKPFITFQGAGKDVTTIVAHDTKADAGKTQDSATVGVNSDGFIAKGITFKNSAPAPPPGAEGAQAVAMRISGDKGAFYECGFLGAQDTLYDDHGRHYFENCYIEGSIDFIFGDGQSIYQGCTLHALAVNPGSLTAQKRSSPDESTGFSFVKCTIGGSGMLYLGRAWGPYSRVVFSFCYIADIVIPQGWFNWGVPSRQNTVFYGQYKCSGPGANENGRVPWSHELTDEQAAPFQTINFIDGTTWLNT